VQDPIPTRPADPASTSLRDRLAGYESHLTPLVNTRLAGGEPEQVGHLRADALDALVYGQALCNRLPAMRSVTVAEALSYGAAVSHVAAALGLEIDEVAAGLRSWADGQHKHASMTTAARDEVHALLDDREVGQ
jgi:hypothetical protein